MIRLWFIVWLALWAGVAAAQNAEVPARIEAAFADWLETRGVNTNALAVTYRGKVVHLGGNAPTQRFEMASLGKAITAACLTNLSRAGRLSLDDTLADHLDRPLPPKLAALTLSGLLTHSAGLWPDSTQKDMPQWLGDPRPRHADVLTRVLTRGKPGKPSGKFRYNNENYALLGEVIARASGQSYREYCHASVLAPYPSARVSPGMGAFDAWGGWQMTVSDYARFHARTFAPRTQNPATLPHAPAYGPGIFYGMGTTWRAFGAGHNFWHLGLLCMEDGQAGAYAVLWENGWGVTLAWDACVPWEAFFELDAALTSATFEP